MTFAAIHCPVFSAQIKIGQAVIKSICVYTKKGFFIMALYAIASEFVVVYVLMALDAIIGLNTGSILKDRGKGGIHVVAIRTFYLLVRPFQWKARPVVVEPPDSS